MYQTYLFFGILEKVKLPLSLRAVATGVNVVLYGLCEPKQGSNCGIKVGFYVFEDTKFQISLLLEQGLLFQEIKVVCVACSVFSHLFLNPIFNLVNLLHDLTSLLLG